MRAPSVRPRPPVDPGQGCRPALSYASTSARSSRELMPSLANTLCRWYSTVRGLMNSWAPISGFESPSRASRAICASWAVSSSLRLDRALAGGLAGGQQLARGALGERLGAHRGEHARGRCAAARARRAAGARGAAIRRRADGRGRARRARGCGRAARSPRGRARSAASPSLSSARERASMPSAQSVPLARAPSSRAARGRRRRARPSRCGRPPRPARPAPRVDHSSVGCSQACSRRGQRVVVAAEAVVEHRARLRATTDQPDSLAPGDRVLHGGLDQRGGLRFRGPARRRAAARRTARGRAARSPR